MSFLGTNHGSGAKLPVFVVLIMLNLALALGVMLRQQHWVVHTLQTKNSICRMQEVMLNLETAQRGYLLTQDRNYLQPYQTNIQHVDEAWNDVERLTADNPMQQRLIGESVSIRDARIEIISNTLKLMAEGRRDEAVAIVGNDSGKKFMDQLRVISGKMQSEEDRLLQQRRTLSNMLALWLVISTCLGLVVSFVLARNAARRVEIENARLESLVTERTDELNKQNIRNKALLDDFHHRLGNSLAMVGAILGHHAKLSTSDDVKNVMSSARERLVSISTAQRRLRLKDSEDLVDVDNYLSVLLNDIRDLLDKDRVTVDIQAEPLELDSRQASTLGVVMNEMIVNASKHAFPDGNGHIQVKLQREGDKVVLEITDDGIGMPEKATSDFGAGMGTRVIEALLRSINATLTTSSQPDGGARPGTIQRIVFDAKIVPVNKA